MATQREILRSAYRAACHPFTFPGGYPLVLVMHDGEICCTQCAAKEFRQIADATLNRDDSGWRVAGVEVYWEGPAVACCSCGGMIESAYGESEE